LAAKPNKVFVCYIPGLDRRRITSEITPYIAQALQRRPWAKINTLPSAELLSSLVSGQRPDQHGIWQARLKRNAAASFSDRVADSLPEFLTVAAQLVRHRLFHDCELPTMPPWRRRHLEFARLKFFGHASSDDLRRRLNGAVSLFDVVGWGDARYRFTDRFADRRKIFSKLGLGDVSLDMLQFHALDMLGHWHPGTSEGSGPVYRETDAFVRSLSEKCKAADIEFVLVSDHGQETVGGSIDLKASLQELDLPKTDYAYFVQPAAARFWFHTQRARSAIIDSLSRTANGTLLSYRDLAQYGVAFEDGAFGETYFVPDPGFILFPHDFHHPLANLYMGLSDPQQRDRLKSPRQVAYHGYLPTNECEKGFMILFGQKHSLKNSEISLLDVAPTLLAMVKCEAPSEMVGQVQID